MRIKNRVFCMAIMLGIVHATTSYAAVSSLTSEGTIRPISQYGLIQNVQDYSTNPFWNKNSPYNQKFPQPVYVTGPELNSAECQSAVGSLVASYCSANNDCIDMTISDIRPFLMLQLSRMPGHNYASSCSGYIDSEFDAYVKNHIVAVPNSNVAFPSATVANPNYDAPEFKLENPYEIKNSTWNGEEWQKEKKERNKELKELQSQNGAGNERVAKADFPTTFADLSFTDKNAIKSSGYEPYKESSAYKTFKIETEDEYQQRLQAVNTAAYNAIHQNYLPEPGRFPSNNNNSNSANAQDSSCVANTTNDGIIHLCLG